MFYVESNDIIQLLCFAFTHRVNSPWYIVWFVIGNVEFRLYTYDLYYNLTSLLLDTQDAYQHHNILY
jgi:hypothetical protein